LVALEFDHRCQLARRVWRGRWRRATLAGESVRVLRRAPNPGRVGVGPWDGGGAVNRPTRRNFLVSAGAGAAAVGAAVIAPDDAVATAPAGATGPLVAYVTDVRRGEITVMVGERGVSVRDVDLAARLARAAR
jgi:hypothetical protein